MGVLLRNLNVSSGGKRILGTVYNGILASQIIAETADGDDGPGMLYNEATQPEYAGKYLSPRITSLAALPGGASLFVHDNGEINASGFPAGTYVFPYDLKVDGVYDSSTTFTISSGISSLAAAGVSTAAGTATISGSVTWHTIAASDGAESTASAAAEVGVALAGSDQASSSAAAAITSGLVGDLAAAGPAESTATADISTGFELGAEGSGTASGIAGVTDTDPGLMAAAGLSESTATADISTVVDLSAAGSGAASGVAGVTDNDPGVLAAVGTVESDGQAAPSVLVDIAASGVAEATATGELFQPIKPGLALHVVRKTNRVDVSHRELRIGVSR